jgi:hypothetical protein
VCLTNLPSLPPQVSRRRRAADTYDVEKVPADVQQIYYLTREWLDDSIARYYTDDTTSTRSHARRLKGTFGAWNVESENEPIVNTPWQRMLWAFLDENDEKLISGFRKFDTGDKPMTLWTGDPAPSPETTKVQEATLFGLLLKKFLKEEWSLGANCKHDKFQDAIFESSSRFYVQEHPQQELHIILRQPGYNRLTPPLSSACETAPFSKSCTVEDPEQKAAMLWTIELPAWMKHTQDYCDGMNQGIPKSDRAKVLKKTTGGDVTIFVETTQECKDRFNHPELFPNPDSTHDPDVPHPCDTYTPDGKGGFAEGECTEDMVASCSCPAAKAIKDRIEFALDGPTFQSCANMMKVQCKPMSDLPGDGGSCDAVQDDAGQRMVWADKSCGHQKGCEPGRGSNCMWCIYDKKKCLASHFSKADCDATQSLMDKMGVSCEPPEGSSEAVMQGWRPSLVLGLVFAGGAAGAGAGAAATYLASRPAAHV